MLRLALRTLRHRIAAFIATVVVMLCGVTIVVACATLLETGIRFSVPPQRLAAAPIVVAGDQTYELPGDAGEATLIERVRIDAAVAEAIEAVPGVAKAVPEVSFPVAVLRDYQPVATDTLGHSWNSAGLSPYRLRAGTAPAGPRDVVVDATLARRSGAAVGDEILLAVPGGTEPFRLAGIAAPAVATTQAAVFFAPSEAERLYAVPRKVDSIGVLLVPGADVAAVHRDLEAALGGRAVVLTGDDRGLAEFPDAPKHAPNLLVIALVFGGMAIVIALFGTATTLALSVQQRHREVALLRAVGATPAQIRRMVLGETLVLAVVTALIAVVPGRLLGDWLFDRLVAGGLAPRPTAFHESWTTSAIAVVVALIAALVAAVVAGRRAAATRPVEALAEADLQRRWFSKTRLIAALVCFWGSAACAAVTLTLMTGPITGSTVGPIVAWFVIGVALLGPAFAMALLAVLGPLVRWLSGLNGRLAVLHARARAVRVAAVVTPITLLTGFAVTDLYLSTTEVTVTQRAHTDHFAADAVLMAPPGGFAPGVIEAVRATPGVGAASRIVTSTGYVESPRDTSQTTDGWPLQGIDADGAAETTPVSLVAGSLTDLRDRSVALSAEHARTLGLNVGDSMSLRLGDGALAELRVVALFKTKPSFTDILLPADLLAEHTTTGYPSQIVVSAASGTDPAAVVAALGQVAMQQPGLWVANRQALLDAYSETVDTQVLATYLALSIIIAFAVILAVNNLAMATARRRREFALQRLIGATRAQILRMVSLEAVLTAGIAVVLGTFISAVALASFGLSRNDSPLPIGPVWIYPAVVGSAFLLTIVATLVPAWLALRPRPIEAVRVAD